MQQITELYSIKHEEILAWAEERFLPPSTKMPLFSSVDLRHSGFKFAHVDLNLFPGGFNNLSSDALGRAAQYVREYISLYYKQAREILLYPEQFTRNESYFSNLRALVQVLEQGGVAVTLIFEDGVIGQGEFTNIITPSQVEWKQGQIMILNNDLMLGVPEFLARYKGPILPSPSLGWHKRRKSTHFSKYMEVVTKLGEHFSFDPWFIGTINQTCDNIDFRAKVNLEYVAQSVDTVLQKTAQKYREYNIDAKPFVFIKSDMGTYGMGIMKVETAAEVTLINKKQRHSMQKVKLGVENSQVIIQEGVSSVERRNGLIAEEMIYSVSAKPCGIFDRINTLGDAYSNLNSKGMFFANCRALPQNDIRYLINFLANIATLHEISEI